MAVVQELDESYFIDRFREMGRGDQFTYEAKQALYEYYDNLSEEISEDIKLDVIAICCDWYERTDKEAIAEYDIDVSECEDDDEIYQAVLDYFNANTVTIDCGGTVLYQAF